MFSGIIECLGKVNKIISEQENLTFVIKSPISGELKIDQSVSHNGACLTVTYVENNQHTVTAIKETLDKTSLGLLKVGDLVNLERCIRLNDRLDGHIVQGHVDQTAVCTSVKDAQGSWLYVFEYDPQHGHITVEKGSVCVNGVSLTVINSKVNSFSVAIIPYTYENTIFHQLRQGDVVNLEFDIIGKYIAKLYQKS